MTHRLYDRLPCLCVDFGSGVRRWTPTAEVDLSPGVRIVGQTECELRQGGAGHEFWHPLADGAERLGTTLGLGATSADWGLIHAAALALDRERWPYGIGRGSSSDAFGGSYFAAWYEDAGLAGLVNLARGVDAIRQDAWRIIHGAVGEMTRAREVQLDDHGVFSIDPGTGLRRIDAGMPGTSELLEARRKEQRATLVRWAEMRIQAAVRVAFAQDRLSRLLAEAGVIQYDPASVICGVTDTLQVTGLRWLAGQRSEDHRVPVGIARVFAEQGLDALRAALAAEVVS